MGAGRSAEPAERVVVVRFLVGTRSGFAHLHARLGAALASMRTESTGALTLKNASIIKIPKAAVTSMTDSHSRIRNASRTRLIELMIDVVMAQVPTPAEADDADAWSGFGRTCCR